MPSNFTDQQLLAVQPPLAEPHFDEEATLLAARPVVPIEMLSATANLSRRWIYPLALTGTLLLGVSAAALYYSPFREPQSNSGINFETVSTGIRGDVSALGVAKSPVAEEQSAAVPAKTRPVTPTREVSQPETTTSKAEQSDKEARKEARAAKREAKELKRAKRERQSEQNSDGVLRIRDIFEGAPRP